MTFLHVIHWLLLNDPRLYGLSANVDLTDPEPPCIPPRVTPTCTETFICFGGQADADGGGQSRVRASTISCSLSTPDLNQLDFVEDTFNKTFDRRSLVVSSADPGVAVPTLRLPEKIRGANITDVTLKSLGIRDVDTEAFEGFTRLQSVNLDSNELEGVPIEALRPLNSSLQTLSVANNSISRVNGTALREQFKGLRFLELGNNTIGRITGRLMTEELEMGVGLSNNPIDSWDFFECSGAMPYHSLNIRNTALNFSEMDFAACTVVELDMSYNDLETIDASKFPEGLKVNLEHNKLAEIRNLDKFKYFQILAGHNRLTAIDSLSQWTFELSAPYNRIERFRPFSDGAPVKEPSLLHFLDLSHNLLTAVEQATFKRFESLQILDLSYNRLATLGSLQNPTLYSVSLAGNAGLKDVLEETALEKLGELQGLKTIDVRDIGVDCERFNETLRSNISSLEIVNC